MLSLQGAWTQSLVGELRSHMPLMVVQKKKKKRYPTSLRLPAASSLHMLLLPAPESLTLQKHKMAGAVEPSGKERGKSLMF